MKKLLIYLLILLAIILGLLKLFFDPIAKSLIEKNLSRDTGRLVLVDSIETNFLKGSIKVNNLEVKNDKIFSRENLILIPLINAKLKMFKLFSGVINFENISIQNPTVNYDVIIKNGKMVDSFYLVENLSKNNSNNQLSEQPTQSQATKTSAKNIPANKGPQIDFVIDTLSIPKINISVLAKDFQFAKNISLDTMTFQNVGNTHNSNHYKDVMAMIVMNMAVKINNEVITSNLKKKFETKLKNFLGSEKLKSIIGSDSEKIIKKLENLFK
jgi:hypothetical protein